MTADDDFNWHDDESIVIRLKPPIAVFANQSGDIEIRMHGDILQDYDQRVIVRPENARALAQAILRAAGLDEAVPAQRLLEHHHGGGGHGRRESLSNMQRCNGASRKNVEPKQQPVTAVTGRRVTAASV